MEKDVFLRFINEKKTPLILLFLVLAIFPYVYLSAYANPIADDFYYAYSSKISSLAKVLVSDYFHWNGRYISNFFVHLNPLVFNSFVWYKIVPVLLIFSTIASIYFFVKSIIGTSMQHIQIWQISLLLFLLSYFVFTSFS